MADRFDIINISKSITTTTGGTTANVNIDANTLFVDGTNNRVGIGTTAPSSPLEVFGQVDVTTSAAAGNGLRIRTPSGSGSSGILQFTNNPVTQQWAYLSAPSQNVLTFGGNSEYARFDSSGRLTVSNQPMFWGVHNTTVTYNVGNLIQITAAYDPNSMFSGASNYRVTVPIAGRYLVSASLLLNTGSAGAFSVQIRKNGSNQRRIFSNQGYGYQHGSDTIILNCAANDYIDLAASDNTQTIYGADIGSFVVYLLG